MATWAAVLAQTGNLASLCETCSNLPRASANSQHGIRADVALPVRLLSPPLQPVQGPRRLVARCGRGAAVEWEPPARLSGTSPPPSLSCTPTAFVTRSNGGRITPSELWGKTPADCPCTAYASAAWQQYERVRERQLGLGLAVKPLFRSSVLSASPALATSHSPCCMQGVLHHAPCSAQPTPVSPGPAVCCPPHCLQLRPTHPSRAARVAEAEQGVPRAAAGAAHAMPAPGWLCAHRCRTAVVASHAARQPGSLQLSGQA